MKSCILALFCCLLLGGCSQERIVNRINIIQSMGVDLEGDTYKISASFPNYIKATREQDVSPMTAESKVTYGIFTTLTSQSSQPIESGQMRTLVISEKFARETISELANIINRESIKSSNAHIVITRQKASQIISETVKTPPFYLSELIDNNMYHGNIPVANYHSFVNQYYGAGQDVYLPVINIDHGKLHMDGVAIYGGNELKLWLTQQEGLYLKILRDKSLTGEYDFKTSSKDMYSFVIMHGNKKLSIAQNGNTSISLEIYIALREIPERINIQNSQDLYELKKLIGEKLSSEMKAMLIRLQKNKVDPVGFGEQYSWHHRNFNEKDFYERIYPHLNFEVQTKIIILHSGVG
ncbi:Ger(x)C family spore germination protein [Paenibacillus glycanilyticus]|uniref:Ger(x)C family spore germination protein n=1 Tax=Paenibacillus glycanilyticus TaxID=126569 RepID=UPI0020410A54|nr:Ger(x)C family spore germination protein [Paenibacillus glycanilyticus]MCM3628349.1 Ger(x)C family spore germination protein [Paenibacillus glycanilyticus]